MEVVRVPIPTQQPGCKKYCGCLMEVHLILFLMLKKKTGANCRKGGRIVYNKGGSVMSR